MQELDPLLELEQQEAFKQPARYSNRTIEDEAIAAYHASGNKQDYFDVFKKYKNGKHNDQVRDSIM